MKSVTSIISEIIVKGKRITLSLYIILARANRKKKIKVILLSFSSTILNSAEAFASKMNIAAAAFSKAEHQSPAEICESDWQRVPQPPEDYDSGVDHLLWANKTKMHKHCTSQSQ